MENSLEGFKCRFELAKERMDELDDRNMEFTEFEAQKRSKKSERRSTNLLDTIRPTSIQTVCVSGEDRIFKEIIAENLLDLMKCMNINIKLNDLQVRQTLRDPHKDTSSSSL